MTMRRRKAKRRRFEVQLRKAARPSTVNGALPPVTSSARISPLGGGISTRWISDRQGYDYDKRFFCSCNFIYSVVFPLELLSRSLIINIS